MAGDTLRSSQRYHALDETAVFGSACRHEFPHMFINLKHGERYSFYVLLLSLYSTLTFLPRIAYAVWLLTEIQEHQPVEVDISVMYDIACTLVRHLKVIYTV